MAQTTLTVNLSVAWWFTALYLPMVLVGVALGFTPNMAKVEFWTAKAVRVRSMT